MGHGKSKSLRFLSPGTLENLLLQMAGMCFNRGPSQAIQRRSFRTQNFDPGQVVRHQMTWSSSQHIAAIRLVRQPAQTITFKLKKESRNETQTHWFVHACRLDLR